MGTKFTRRRFLAARGRRYILGPDELRSARERFKGQDPGRRVLEYPEGVAYAERLIRAFGACVGLPLAP